MGGRQTLGALTGLRFFAAAAIVLHHLAGVGLVPKQWTEGYALSHGVTLFFVLSGFILTYQYRSERKLDVGRFLVGRVARVFPSHLVMLAVVVSINGVGAGAGTLALNAALLQSWSPDGSVFFSYNAVSWSLSTELAFYVAFPFLVGRVDRLWPLYVAAGLATGLALAWYASRLDLPVYSPQPGQWSGLGLTMVNPLARMMEFTAGMAAASLFARYTGRTLPPLWASGIEALALIVFLFNISLGKALVLPILPDWKEASSFWFWNSLIPVVPCAFLIYALAIGKGMLATLLSLRPLHYAGTTSFALYLVHPTAIDLALWVDGGLPALAVFVVVAVGGAVLLYELIEKPARRLIVHRFKPQAIAATLVASSAERKGGAA